MTLFNTLWAKKLGYTLDRSPQVHILTNTHVHTLPGVDIESSKNLLSMFLNCGRTQDRSEFLKKCVLLMCIEGDLISHFHRAENNIIVYFHFIESISVSFGHWLIFCPLTFPHLRAQRWFHKAEACKQFLAAHTEIQPAIIFKSCKSFDSARRHLCPLTHRGTRVTIHDADKNIYMISEKGFTQNHLFCMAVLFFKNILIGIGPQEQQNISLKHSLVWMLFFFFE